MLTQIRQFTRTQLLSYLEDCHALTADDIENYSINPKSKSDLADAIECYGWAPDCQAYLSN